MGHEISREDKRSQAGYGLGYVHSGNLIRPGGEKMTGLEAAQTNLARSADLQARWNLDQQQEAWDLKKKSAETSGKLAGQFLNQWSSSVAGMGDFYKQLVGGISGESGPMAGQMGKLNELTDMVGKEYQTYKSDYGDMSKEFLGNARDESRIRRDLGMQLKDMSDPEYANVTGRAAADVGAQSEMARQSSARQMQGMGIDPSSGRFGALNRQSYMDEARNTAVAMNLARRGEKERATNLKGQVLGMMDPSKSANIGLGLNKQGQNLLGIQGELAKAGVAAQTAQTKVLGDIGTSYAQNVTKPYGEMAGYFLGASGGQGLPSQIGNTGSQIASYQTQQIPGRLMVPQAAR